MVPSSSRAEVNRFNKYLPEIIKLVEAGFSPKEQLGHYDLNLDWWRNNYEES